VVRSTASSLAGQERTIQTDLSAVPDGRFVAAHGAELERIGRRVRGM